MYHKIILFVISAFLLTCSQQTQKTVLVTGHRGASGLAPENTISSMLKAIEAGADIVLLDNFTAQDVGGVHEVLTQREMRDKVLLEASGGINEDNIKDYAQSGVDIISSGALTHSYDSADFNMLLSIT